MDPSCVVIYSRIGLPEDQTQLEEFKQKEEIKMPEIKEYPYLTGEGIGAEAEVTFLTPHVEKLESETGLDHVTSEVMISLPNGEKRNWTMNKTSMRQLVKQLGGNIS